jgi:hypothetical protein
VYLYGLRYETAEMARTHAFAVLVFAELLRSFWVSQRDKAHLENAVAIEREPRGSRGFVIRPASVQSSQCDIGKIPQNVAHTFERLFYATGDFRFTPRCA